MKNKKGFTLIEWLAVIVILGIILAFAIPAVAQYISSSKKGTYIANARSYATAARYALNLNDGEFAAPVNNGDAIVISFKELEPHLESGGKKSPYGGVYIDEFSYVVVVNSGTAEKPRFLYYIAALDEKGYGIGVEELNSAKPIQYDDLSEKNIRQLGKVGASVSSIVANIDEVTISRVNCYPDTLCTSE